MKVGKWLIAGGLLLLAAALCLTVYNIREQTQAAQAAADALEQMATMVNKQPQVSDPNAGQAGELVIPDHLRDPEMDMPELEIDGELYIGSVSIPALGLELPVISEWSYPRLKLAPCRYQGSAYLNDLIIMAHNYTTHFGALGNLQPGDVVYFKDMNGNVFQYQVVELETLGGTAVEEMTSGDWDLTLFTCTVGGKSRVTVRCEQVLS